MQIQFWSIGKTHENYVEPGITDFTKRIGNYFPVSWKIISPPRNPGTISEHDLKRKEAEAILKLLSDRDYLVALDIKGKSLQSQELAQFIMQRGNESSKLLIFLIGGAFGIDTAIMKRADFLWSLSNLTFPHQLVRLILTEQVYRACTIIRNEKYHHS